MSYCSQIVFLFMLHLVVYCTSPTYRLNPPPLVGHWSGYICKFCRLKDHRVLQFLKNQFQCISVACNDRLFEDQFFDNISTSRNLFSDSANQFVTFSKSFLGVKALSHEKPVEKGTFFYSREIKEKEIKGYILVELRELVLID